MSFSAWLGLAASLVYLARLLPQPIKTLCSGEVQGVSILAAMNVFIADVSWLAYGLSRHVVPVWAVSIPSMLVSAWTVCLLRRTLAGRDAAAAGAWLAVLLAAGAVGLLQVALAATVLVTCGPQLWSAYHHEHPTGVARSTWWVAVLDASAWGIYGLVTHDVAVEMYGVVLLATALAMLLRLHLIAGRAVRGSIGPAGWPASVGSGQAQAILGHIVQDHPTAHGSDVQ